MAQPLRITVNNADYHFKLISVDSSDKSNIRISVELNGIAVVIVRSNKSWITTADISDPNVMEIAEAIGKSVALRYRI